MAKWLATSLTLVLLTHLNVTWSGTPDIIIPRIEHHYCVSPYSKSNPLSEILETGLLDFSSYKNFDGKGAPFKVLVFNITPFDLVASIEVPEARQTELLEGQSTRISTSAVFAIQPTPAWKVEGKFYPKLKLDCLIENSHQDDFESENGSFQYTCELDTQYNKNFGLKRFDTVIIAKVDPSMCKIGEYHLFIRGDMVVDGEDFIVLKQGILQAMPQAFQILGDEFFSAFFDVPKLFTNFYNNFYGGWIKSTPLIINREW